MTREAMTRNEWDETLRVIAEPQSIAWQLGLTLSNQCD
jgi:hypothetical protein